MKPTRHSRLRSLTRAAIHSGSEAINCVATLNTTTAMCMHFVDSFPSRDAAIVYIASSALRLQWEFMKARVYVSMKPSVLDPQGQTIRSALAGLGHTSIAAVRQGKYFEITLEPGTDRTKASAEIEQIARDVLANPVIEEYRVEFVE